MSFIFENLVSDVVNSCLFSISDDAVIIDLVKKFKSINVKTYIHILFKQYMMPVNTLDGKFVPFGIACKYYDLYCMNEQFFLFFFSMDVKGIQYYIGSLLTRSHIRILSKLILCHIVMFNYFSSSVSQ